MNKVVVVGSGQSGLILARKLADASVDVTCVERLPAPGGQEPEPRTRSMVREATRAGVKWSLGTLAVEFSAGSLSTLGVNGAVRLPADQLALATGTRPASRAQLGIAGDRGAGILPGSVVHHYLDSGVLPGRYPLVLGDGQLAQNLCAQLLECGAVEVASVRSDVHGERTFQATKTYWASQIDAVEGVPRVSAAYVRSGDTVLKVPTDAVVMAAGRLPMRNIESALNPGRHVVDCFSSDDPKTIEGAEAAAHAAFNQVMTRLN